MIGKHPWFLLLYGCCGQGVYKKIRMIVTLKYSVLIIVAKLKKVVLRVLLW
jgi:hypothetical protein